MSLQEPDWNRFVTRYEPPTNRFFERKRKRKRKRKPKLKLN